ncbi:dihydroxyacetone kinase phosphoryl donor subunit DhaM [Halalkalicoccus jeotgali]|uniref:phosphoenolpyruvate--glycerone phosphotransferase n=1 Tax=Halalkalicoccus jeotgali (strain DSM 18796 / CECT 7217 / JCM 14584 / KCTC 4019 / B3) TaxID=795797 RepID=D8J2D4_HALJB|nr:dihydroxyacetone kinase phosphoryl donor subunit DhaM [Halalkalicoccus jeotgali]ADJ14891.1 dihydroxyacetone kinase, phosphotransfer subunit [Halalkalicoccus jeotgali B3]ELY39473.1 dihydroxyacetone kinase, phosphotransfer subunit [Halalkalicoccus jeotgali B3]
MIGLVVVSHSARLAEGVCEVAGEMASEASIVPAGGTDGGELGTSVDLIADAIEAASAGAEGVVVLADLGSAVMNAEMAVEVSEIEATFADAPLVEGAVNAAVSATSAKATLESVRESAEEAGDLSKT